MSDIVIIGGPNGAGKTTAAKVLLPEIGIEEFVNADEIARGLSPLNPARAAIPAGRAMLERIRGLIAQDRSFAFEITCSGRAYGPLLRRCREAIYDNSDKGRVLIAERKQGADIVVCDSERWTVIEREL